MTKKERSLLKGAFRRVFSRSELRKRILDAALVKDYSDPSRKRVTRWGRCAKCQKLEPAYLLEIDHIDPFVPIGSSFEEMSLDVAEDRLFCDERLLQALCEQCHDEKSASEAQERKKLKPKVERKRGDKKK